MTTNEQLYQCKRCNNRRMDMDQGLICALTGSRADFEETCETFDLDARMQAEMENSPEYSGSELNASISDEKLQRIRAEQNLPFGIIGAILVGLVGACLWAMITIATGWQIGYMALAIGAGVGYTLRYLGKGIDQVFGVSGAIIAVVSCVIGNFLSVLGFIADQEGLTYLDTLLNFDYSYSFAILTETAGMMDLVFYGIAGYEGYKFAFREFSPAQLASLK